ncbi:MAG: 3-keto-disaccharide hydrolase [Candidatus Cyclobacteriaceae bacterium M3_2C_046]
MNFISLRMFSALFVLSIFMLAGCQPGAKEGATDETEISEEVSEAQDELEDEDWIVLFDGESVDHWIGYQKDSFPEQGWEVVDGTLRCIGSGMGEAGGAGGDIITKDMYENFELQLDWKISEGGNSGIFYLAREIEGEPIWKSALEYQILDNERHLDANLGKDGNRQAGSLYDLIPAKPQNANPAGEWNTARIIVYQGTVVHFMNGEQVLEYHLWTDDWNEMVENSKFSDFEPFAESREGHIGLQDHGNDVWFRNIRIKEM